MLDSYRRMHEAFLPLRRSLAGREMTAEELVRVLGADKGTVTR